MENGNNDFLLTIAIPTYNRANYLKRALQSIAEQYDSRLEILVSNNASEDTTRLHTNILAVVCQKPR